MLINECPQCGAPATPGSKNCGFCASPFILAIGDDLTGKNEGVLAKYANLYRTVQKDDADYAVAQIALITVYLERKLYAPADGAARKLVEEYPDFGDAYLARASCIISKCGARKLTLALAREAADLICTGIDVGADRRAAAFVGDGLLNDYFKKNGIRPPQNLLEFLAETGR